MNTITSAIITSAIIISSVLVAATPEPQAKNIFAPVDAPAFTAGAATR